LRNQKAQRDEQVLTSVYTNLEIFVKIGSLDSELRGLKRRPLKNKNKEKNIGKIYSPVGNLAEQAK